MTAPVKEVPQPDDRVYRSVSQINQYERCPYSYYLQRIQKVWQRPAAWSPQGSAVHEAAEVSERSGRTLSLEQVLDVFSDSYVKHIEALTADTPNLDYWFASGPYRGADDIERRFGIGLEQTERYVDYYAKSGEDIWTPPGSEGGGLVEYPFEMDLDGVWVRGYLDQVVRTANGGLIVRDLKTGKKPGDEFQLATYKEAINREFAVNIVVGDYWMARNGKPTVPYKLEGWTTERLTEVYHEVDSKIRAGDFPAKPEPDKCRFCSVQTSCSFSLA